MLSSEKEFSGTTSKYGERRTSETGKLSTKEEEKTNLELERAKSREYRRRYNQRQKDKDQMLQSQLEATEMELQRLRLEHAALVSQSHALSSLCTYSNSMIESLTAAASASVTKARSLACTVIEGGNTFAYWCKNQFLKIPTVTELRTGTFFTPSDEHLRWRLKNLKPEEYFSRQKRFLDHLTLLVEEINTSPETQKNNELRINHMISILVRCSV
jgi:hypothetical protein